VIALGLAPEPREVLEEVGGIRNLQAGLLDSLADLPGYIPGYRLCPIAEQASSLEEVRTPGNRREVFPGSKGLGSGLHRLNDLILCYGGKDAKHLPRVSGVYVRRALAGGRRPDLSSHQIAVLAVLHLDLRSYAMGPMPRSKRRFVDAQQVLPIQVPGVPLEVV
jgi:hypothetical protein